MKAVAQTPHITHTVLQTDLVRTQVRLDISNVLHTNMNAFYAVRKDKFSTKSGGERSMYVHMHVHWNKEMSMTVIRVIERKLIRIGKK